MTDNERPQDNNIATSDYRKLRELVNLIVWNYTQLGAIEKAALSQEIIDAVYAKFGKDSNALVPLDSEELLEVMVNNCTQIPYKDTYLIGANIPVMHKAILAKFGKDNNGI